MYGKLIDGNLQVAGNIITTDKGTITNPKAEQLIELGYKEIEYSEKPTYDKEEEKLQEVYTDGDKITVSYEKVALSAEEHNEIIKQEIIEEEKKMTDRNIRGAILNNEYDINEITKIETKIAQLRPKIRPVEVEE